MMGWARTDDGFLSTSHILLLYSSTAHGSTANHSSPIILGFQNFTYDFFALGTRWHHQLAPPPPPSSASIDAFLEFSSPRMTDSPILVTVNHLLKRSAITHKHAQQMLDEMPQSLHKEGKRINHLPS